MNIKRYESKYNIKTTEIIGIIIDYKISDTSLEMIVKGKEKVQVRYYFKDQREKDSVSTKVKFGNLIQLKGILVKPQANTLPNTFNYKNYLYYQKIYWIFEADNILVIKENKHIFYTLKNICFARADNFKKMKPYIQAFILSDSSYIASDIITIFKNNGVLHLLAVSGMHIGLLTYLVGKILDFFKIKKNKIFVLTIMILIFYLFLIGFTPSSLRATFMYMFSIINKKCGLNVKTGYLLYYIFFFFLIINPFYIHNIGFLYSFGIAFGLVLFKDKIKGNYLVKIFKVSFLAFIFSLPITLYNYYEFNLMTVLNNIIIVPLVSLVLFPLAWLVFCLPFLEPLGYWCFSILEFINNLLNNMALMIIVSKISILFILIYYGIIYLCHKYSFKYLSLIILLFLGHYINCYLNNNAYVYYLDVGQGDATLIVTEHRRDIIMIDSGGKQTFFNNKENSYAKNIVLFLKSLGISQIDLFIATHGDIDHIGYAKDMFKYIEPKKVLLNFNEYNTYEKELGDNYKILKEDIYIGNRIVLQNLNKTISANENESSLVIATKIKNKGFLFMGDAPKKIEKEVISKYKLSDIDVLKVGHHGSKTSSGEEFINMIKPKYSIISVGRTNKYGHPNKEVLDILNNSKIYRTDLDGSVIFKIKKDKLEIDTCMP